MTSYYPYRAWPSPVVLDQDDRLWDNAVATLSQDLKDKTKACNCSCGKRGCSSSKGAWR